jgi:predicted metal-dependent hydrolase
MKNMEKTIDGKELGLIVVRQNLRAKHYALRVVDGKIIATIPRGGTEREMLAFIKSKQERLLEMLAKSPERPVLNEDCNLKTYTFELQVFRTNRTNLYVSLKEGKLHIACPEETDFADEQIQQILWNIVTNALRVEALRILPSRVNMLASLHGFDYKGVAVRKSGTRWGSCSAKKQINLSVSLMLLPDYLIDYVILHELCHTVEMNHGERFWSLLNKVTNGDARKLRKELKEYQMKL